MTDTPDDCTNQVCKPSGSGKTRSSVRLSHKYVAALQPQSEPYRVPDRGCLGLAVRVSPTGAKTWDLSFRIRGNDKTRRMSLGNVRDLSLEQARDRANRITSAARQGRDLLAEDVAASAEAASRITIEQLIERYMERSARNRCRTAKDIERRLRKTLEPVFSMAAADVRKRDIRALLDSKAEEGFLREAEQRRLTASGMFKWAVRQDYIEINPMSGLASYGRSAPRERVLTDAEITTLWPWLGSDALPDSYGDVMKLQLLLGARCSEVGGMSAAEIDQTKWLWTLPPERSKNKRSRVTPLIGLAREIVKARIAMFEHGPLCGTHDGLPLNATHIGNVLNNRRGHFPIAKFTSHDLRRTVMTKLAELGVAIDTIAAVAGHMVGGPQVQVLMRHYVKTDFIEAKTEALWMWDAKLRQLIDAPAPPACESVPPASAIAAE